ncbi:MAG: DNA mismatch repair protein MutL [Flavobacteriales bacterium]|jgi:DNA mismatch repair protein MutL
MPDIIQLLPDAIANQIAAGEVVQRPASVVKELLENAVDSGASIIKLIIKDAGKTLIQVIDNGCGMSETDARMSFERHATSKIKKAEDLFALHTKGFRGEALASIAAIAHVELKTKKLENELGCKLVVEGTTVKEQEAFMCVDGSSFSVKNLFYNVPARRQFLKSEQVEMKHIIDEFQRVALAHPGIQFILDHNKNEIYNLAEGNLKQRLMGVFGKKYDARLVPVTETTDIVQIDGFVGKPEYAKKTRGEQFFFVNNRYIKSSYLHHSVGMAFEELIGTKQHPSYFLNLTLDPATIDINIHPTKTEIKFKDERVLYAILKSAVKQSLGKYNIAPSLDFEQETAFNIPLPKKDATIPMPSLNIDPSYNPFDSEKSHPSNSSSGSFSSDNFSYKKPKTDNWEELYAINKSDDDAPKEPEQTVMSTNWGSDNDDVVKQNQKAFQWQNGFIITKTKSGLLLIDQQRAHERVLFEHYTTMLAEHKSASQQLLFPETISLNPSDMELMIGLKVELKELGFDLEQIDNNNIAVNGVPSDAADHDPNVLIETLLEQFKNNVSQLSLGKKEQVAFALASSTSIKRNKTLSQEEINGLIDQLFACQNPYHTCKGKPTIVTFTLDEVQKRFQ